MRRGISILAGVALLGPMLPGPVEAQTPSPLEIGAVAPDITLAAAVRHGVLAEPFTLSDYAGQTVVLSFFYRARTKG